MNEVLYQIDRPDQDPVLLKLWFSDNEPESDGCDACIGYQIFDLSTHGCLDGGEFDYDSASVDYDTPDDAVDDVVGFVFDSLTTGCKPRTDLDPDDFVD